MVSMSYLKSTRFVLPSWPARRSVPRPSPRPLPFVAYQVQDAIKSFSEAVRSGEWKGATGQPLTDVVAVGIGGSYLGPEFVAEALRTDATAAAQAAGRRLRFLANVDPVDFKRAVTDLDPATTLVVVRPMRSMR